LNVIERRRAHEPLGEDLRAGTRSPDESWEREDASVRVQAALMDLSPDHRQVLVLRHFADLSYRDIAEALDINEKTVKSRLFSARRTLHDVLIRRGVVAS
jgi:RNA polymerase sigma-70 factor (ECF subfamily)